MIKQKPNIIYMMADDHAAKAISLYQSRLASVFKTPNLDRIGREGAILHNCHCTNAICTPSRATILTGQYSHINGVKTLDDSLDVDLLTFPQMLQNNGYQTAVIGKWHVHSEPQGFDHYDILPGQGLYFDPYFVDNSFEWPETGYPVGRKTRGHVTDLVVDKSLDWLANRDQTKPFMLMCHFKAPHDFFEYHPRYENIFSGMEIPEPDSLFEDKSHRSIGSRNYGTTISETNPRRNYVKHFSESDHPTGQVDFSGLSQKERTKKAYQKYLKDYLRCIKGIDDNVGRLLDYLDAEGLTENTIVIYTSDQGMFLGEHDYMDKRWIYEEALQMPFMIRYPAEISAGSVIEDIVTNVDFAPTFLDYAGLRKTNEMQGRSFRKVVKGNTPADWENKLYYRYWMHLTHHDNPAHYGIRTKDYKLIFFYGLPLDASGAINKPTPPGWELYDLKNDPEELHNIYHDPAYRDIVAELKQELYRMKETLGDRDEIYLELLKRVKETI